MEKREDLGSILPYLPVMMRSSTLFWPPKVVEALRELGRGPLRSGVDSGQFFFRAISGLRSSLSLSSEPLAPSASHGYACFFDKLMSREESRKWFEEVIPALGNLLLRLPSLLEAHYENADMIIDGGGGMVRTGLRLLDSQEAGIVFLSQELIAALLGCSLFCLFPVCDRSVKNLPMINFDELFASLYDDYSQKQENKIRCIAHYFQRVSSDMPKGVVSFERKVLPYKGDPIHIYPNANFWSASVIPLCKFEVHSSGLIEDQSSGAVEVDFANQYLGGGALRRGCVQEEIRFMICPELIAGMLFLPSMEDNEAIDIVGVERFSSNTGYGSSFRFSGDYVDKRDVDPLGRRETRIVAIDALCRPGMTQYWAKNLLREINKAFCGFLYHSKYQQYQKISQENECSSVLFDAAATTSMETSEEQISNNEFRNSQNDFHRIEQGYNIGVATGNWGCGAFGGDPEVKTIIQWLAASQALRPFIAYYTYGFDALQNLDKVTDWILSERWTVGDLWEMLIKYSTKRSEEETNVGFLQWLLPSVYGHDAGMDLTNTP